MISESDLTPTASILFTHQQRIERAVNHILEAIFGNQQLIFQLNADSGMRNGVVAEFDAPVVLKAFSKNVSGNGNYIVAEKNRGNPIDQKYMIHAKAVKPLYEAKEND